MKSTTAQQFGSLGKSFGAPAAAAAVIGAALLASDTSDTSETAWSPSAACLLPDVLPVAGTLLSYGGSRQLAAGGTVTHGGALNIGANAFTCGAITASGAVTASSGNITTNSGQFIANASGSNMILLNSAGTVYGSIGNDAGDKWSLGYKATTATTLGTPVLTWTASGFVGINKVSPTVALDVVGAITASGTVTTTALRDGGLGDHYLASITHSTGFNYFSLNSNGLNLGNTAGIRFYGALNVLGTPDTTLTRNAAGVLQVGTTANNALGSLLLTNLTLSGEIRTPYTTLFSSPSGNHVFYDGGGNQELNLSGNIFDPDTAAWSDKGINIIQGTAYFGDGLGTYWKSDVALRRTAANTLSLLRGNLATPANFVAGAITASAAVTSPGVVLTGTAGAPDIRTVTDNIALRLITNNLYNLGVHVTSYSFNPNDTNYGLGTANNGWAFNYFGAGAAVGMITGALDTVKIRNRLNSADGALTCGATHYPSAISPSTPAGGYVVSYCGGSSDWQLKSAYGAMYIQIGGGGATFVESYGNMTVGGTGGVRLQSNPASSGPIVFAKVASSSLLAFRDNADAADLNITTGAITASSSIQETPTQSSLNPTTTDIPSGKRQGWYNTALAEFRDWVNVGGTLLKSAAYT